MGGRYTTRQMRPHGKWRQQLLTVPGGLIFRWQQFQYVVTRFEPQAVRSTVGELIAAFAEQHCRVRIEGRAGLDVSAISVGFRACDGADAWLSPKSTGEVHWSGGMTWYLNANQIAQFG